MAKDILLNVRRQALSRTVRGFTLTELIVVLGIVALTSTIVMFNYRGSRESVTLSTTALDVASMIRIAQTGGRAGSQGLDVDKYLTQGQNSIIGQGSTTSESTRAGVYFDVVSSEIQKIIVYRNRDSSFGYGQGVDVKLEERRLASPSVVARLCAGKPNFALKQDCSTHSGSQAIEFSRLASDPYLSQGFINNNGTDRTVVIQLESSAGGAAIYRYIVVESSGNIFVR